MGRKSIFVFLCFFFSNLILSNCNFLERRQKCLKNALSNQLEIFKLSHITHYTISGIYMNSIDPN